MYKNWSHCDLSLTLNVKVKKLFLFFSLYVKMTAEGGGGGGICIILTHNASIIMADMTFINEILTNGEIVYWKKFLPGCTKYKIIVGPILTNIIACTMYMYFHVVGSF